MTSNIPDFESSRKFSSVFDSPFSTDKIVGQGIVENHSPSKEDAGVFRSLFGVSSQPVREPELEDDDDKWLADYQRRQQDRIKESAPPPEFESSSRFSGLSKKSSLPPEFDPQKSVSKYLGYRRKPV